jgi:Uma2 family endonuclease
MHMATTTKRWTLEELHALPDDGNKYELIHGELFVTPPPTDDHETISARLTRILDPYVARHGLGYVYHPRAVVRFQGSEVEPDLMVRQPQGNRKAKWENAPIPALIVEILSPYTRRRDQAQKRDFYIDDVAIPEYWVVDPETSTIRRIKAGAADSVERERLTWSPKGASEPLTIDVAALFG